MIQSKATHSAILELDNIQLDCFKLSDGKLLIEVESLATILNIEVWKRNEVIEFMNNSIVGLGIEVTLLPDLCDRYIKQVDNTKNKAYSILKTLAKAGIVTKSNKVSVKVIKEPKKIQQTSFDMLLKAVVKVPNPNKGKYNKK